MLDVFWIKNTVIMDAENYTILIGTVLIDAWNHTKLFGSVIIDTEN